MTDPETHQTLVGMKSIAEASKGGYIQGAGKLRDYFLYYDWVFATNVEKIALSICVLWTGYSFISWIWSIFT